MDRFNREVPRPMYKPDMAGRPTGGSTPERKLVPEGPLQAERQAFMDVAREVFKGKGYGSLKWDNGDLTSYADVDRTTLEVHNVPLPDNPEGGRLLVYLDGNDYLTSNVELSFTNESYHYPNVAWDNHEGTKVTFTSSGEVVKPSYHAEGQAGAREATTEELQFLLTTATEKLSNVLKSSQWVTRAENTVKYGDDEDTYGWTG